MDTHGKIRVHVVISTVDETLKAADQLLDLASEHPRERSALCASASVVCASALAQFIDSSLHHVRSVQADIRAGGEDTEARSEPLRRKMMRLPTVLWEQPIDLKNGHEVPRALHGLISFRNLVLHISEETDTLEFAVPEDGRLEFRVPFPQNPWTGDAPVETAGRYHQAVSEYIRKLGEEESWERVSWLAPP